MNRIKHPVVILSLLLAFASGCKKDEAVDPVVPEDFKPYFPVAAGNYRIYDVDSIQFYDVTMTSDTFQFQIKEEVSMPLTVEEVSNDENKTWYELKIYRRADTSQAWQQTGYAMESVSSLSGERIQNNLHFISLSFPVKENKSWKGNAFLTDSLNSPFDPDWDYTYTTIDTTFIHQAVSYPSSIVVTQYDSQNQIEKDIEREAYARGIGLVYKESVHVERQNTTNPLGWVPEKGTIMTKKLREHNY